MPYAEPLADAEIAARMGELAGWEREGGTLARTYQLKYLAGLALITHAVVIEEGMNHHADITYTYGGVRFAITTHAAGGKLTAKDFDLAGAIDRAAAAHAS